MLRLTQCQLNRLTVHACNSIPTQTAFWSKPLRFADVIGVIPFGTMRATHTTKAPEMNFVSESPTWRRRSDGHTPQSSPRLTAAVSNDDTEFWRQRPTPEESQPWNDARQTP